jgi:hypothetical protein
MSMLDIGARCASCALVDFLPTTCPHCGLIYCRLSQRVPRVVPRVLIGACKEKSSRSISAASQGVGWREVRIVRTGRFPPDHMPSLRVDLLQRPPRGTRPQRVPRVVPRVLIGACKEKSSRSISAASQGVGLWRLPWSKCEVSRVRGESEIDSPLGLWLRARSASRLVRRCNEAWIYRADTDRRERRSSSSAQTCRPLCGAHSGLRFTPDRALT